MTADYCFVVSIKANPSWLTLDRGTRDGHWKIVSSIVKQYAEQVSFQYYDSDAFYAHMSDMIICVTKDPLDYHHLWDRIKDTSVFCEGFYTITDVRSGIRGVSHG